MVRFIAVVAFAASVLATPAVNPAAFTSEGLNRLTTGEAVSACGNNLEINCCNKQETSNGDKVAPAGLIPSLLNGILGEDGLGGLGLFSECSPITVGGIPGVSELLRNNCHAKVACCDKAQTVSGGLINVGLPCIALGSII